MDGGSAENAGAIFSHKKGHRLRWPLIKSVKTSYSYLHLFVHDIEQGHLLPVSLAAAIAALASVAATLFVATGFDFTCCLAEGFDSTCCSEDCISAQALSRTIAPIVTIFLINFILLSTYHYFGIFRIIAVEQLILIKRALFPLLYAY